MIVKKTLAEMTAEWRLRNGFSTVVPESFVEREDGYCTDDLVERKIDDWYEELLANGPVDWMPLTNIQGKAMVVADTNGVVRVTLPENCCRVVSAKLAGWQRAATLLHDSDSLLARLQSSPYVCGGDYNPIGIVSEGMVTLIKSSSTRPSLEYLMCVLRPEAEEDSEGRMQKIYKFNPAALSTLGSVIP